MTGSTVLERGRRKALRPLSAERRRAAVAAGLAAYRRGDWFLAHEQLEPAWMGSADPAERALSSGLIKLAAAGVHAARGNPAGVARNLAGARERLATAAAAAAVGTGRRMTVAGRIDLRSLIDAVDARLAAAPSCAPPPALPLLG